VASLAPVPGAPAGPAEELVEFGVSVRSQWRLILARFLRHRLAMASLVMLVVLFVVAFLGETLSRNPYNEPSAAPSLPPSMEHWFGTNSIGTDVFSQVQRAAQRSMEVALLVALLSTTFGALAGAVAGYFRGWLDAVLMRLTDLFLTIPTLAVLLVVSNKYKNSDKSWLVIVLIIAAFAWMPLARLVRGVALSLREREFVGAARAVGVRHLPIMCRHILPNALPVVIPTASLRTAGAIITEASLSFLGVGDPNVVSLGQMLMHALQFMRMAWWTATFPGLIIFATVLALNLVGDGLNDALNPRLRQR
jgi:peptide/nickel transport system permease protein